MELARVSGDCRRIAPRRVRSRRLRASRGLRRPLEYRIPGWRERRLATENIRSRSTCFSTNTVTMPDQAADFDIREPVEVRTNTWQLPLNFWVQRRRILLRIDNIGDAGEHEAGRVFEGFVLQLPDTIHENIAGSHGRANKPARS